jgi:hypothetical protein
MKELKTLQMLDKSVKGLEATERQLYEIGEGP